MRFRKYTEMGLHILHCSGLSLSRHFQIYPPPPPPPLPFLYAIYGMCAVHAPTALHRSEIDFPPGHITFFCNIAMLCGFSGIVKTPYVSRCGRLNSRKAAM